ncbi:MAG: alpha/beta hydrolase [Hyphomonadaceae bacterium]|nr:alpha/beta hydrolase [Hyphomonadaceae bacterium]
MAFVQIPGNPAPEGAEEIRFKARDGVELRAMIAPARGPARGTVVICQGWKEFIEKYFEVARELQARGFAVFAMDWRGQGLSGREARPATKSYFRTLDDPAKDLGFALQEFGGRLPRPHILLAHSMGGGISLRALQKKYVSFDGALFNAPMWGIRSMNATSAFLVGLLRGLGAGKAYAPGAMKTWTREDFASNNVTRDEARQKRTQDLIEANQGLAMAGASIGWAASAADAIKGFQPKNAFRHLTFPIVVLTAADERLVRNESHAEIAAKLPDAQHFTIANAMHEIMMERDEIRAQFWSAFDALADRVAPRKAA